MFCNYEKNAPEAKKLGTTKIWIKISLLCLEIVCRREICCPPTVLKNMSDFNDLLNLHQLWLCLT